MGIGEWFKKTFGKQPCAFCGAEVGMLKRTKTKDKLFICNDCRRGCSKHMEVYRHTKDELLEHMEYMKRQNALYESMGMPTLVVTGTGSHEGIEFYDEAGMFRIRDTDTDDRYPKDMIRYDQVAHYEPFCHENEPEEQGKPKTFEECGVTITLVGVNMDADTEMKGLRPHPYITRELEVVINKKDKRTGMLEVGQIIHKFDAIFGVGDSSRGLFQFGMTTQQKREAAAIGAIGGVISEAIKAAAEGEAPETFQGHVQDAVNKVNDVATSGLAKYSRLADEAEAKIQ